MKFQFKNLAYKGLVLLALLIVAITLWYTNSLANQLKNEEYKKVALWAKATKLLSNINDENLDIGFIFEVVNNNTTVPVIQVNDAGEIINDRNIKNECSPSETGRDCESNCLAVVTGNGFCKNEPSQLELKRELKLMKKNNYEPIIIELIDGKKEYIYYKDSSLLHRLKRFPFFMFSIVAAFMLLAYSAFSNARIAQQNKVWTGMAKETAHQIGTPLSSLIGWLEYLKENNIDKSIVKKIQKDLDRLTTIASRFSKIGSLPKLRKTNIVPILKQSIDYMKQRVSSQTSIQFNVEKKETQVLINADLFEWVTENIIKNSIDATDQKGKIIISLIEEKNRVFIDFSDNGRGLKKTFFKKIFQPGFTSKKRGWGLGLSLVKRIIQDYHKGWVRVLKSIPNKETTIRICLNK
tara:strand:- start:6996 stop:8219 length:1224 start_codon:yes stop_codon:yes gene_type:complete